LGLACFLFAVLSIPAHTQPALTFNRLNIADNLPDRNVQKVYQDRDGFIWIATRSGLYRYDGYSLKTYKSTLNSPNLLCDNNILCLQEDENHRLWIGTHKGLNMLDKITGKLICINRKEFDNNSISQITATKNGGLYLGTEQGLYCYVYKTDSCILYSRDNTGGVLPRTSITALMEDSQGDLWIGTWDAGLYRYDAGKDLFYSYPRMNEGNSAHAVFEDSQKRIWVGTWGAGLFLLDNIYSPQHTTWKIFRHNQNDPHSILSDIIYNISEDLNTQTLWVGTSLELSLLPMNALSSFANYYHSNSDYSIAANDANSLIRDRQGIMWIGMIGGGVNFVNTTKPVFDCNRLNFTLNGMDNNSIHTIFVDSEGLAWLGVRKNSFVVEDRKTGNITHYKQLPDFASLNLPDIETITQSLSTGEIWIGTHNSGVLAYNKSAPQGQRVKHYMRKNAQWLSSDCVYAIKEDR
jgi:ligand-binding sensor domain-containing protein